MFVYTCIIVSMYIVPIFRIYFFLSEGSCNWLLLVHTVQAIFKYTVRVHSMTEVLITIQLVQFCSYSVCTADKERIKISLYGGLKLEGEILVRSSSY